MTLLLITDYIDFKTLITVFFALLGLFLTHLLTRTRDRNNKARETSLTYVKTAYESLNKGILLLHMDKMDESTEYLEKAFVDIQMFGTKEQVDAVYILIRSMSSGQYTFDPVLNSLRNYLRDELKLPKEERTILHITPAKSLLKFLEKLEIVHAGLLNGAKEMNLNSKEILFFPVSGQGHERYFRHIKEFFKAKGIDVKIMPFVPITPDNAIGSQIFAHEGKLAFDLGDMDVIEVV